MLFTETSIKSKSDTCLQTFSPSIKDDADFDEVEKVNNENLGNFEVGGYMFVINKAENSNYNYDRSFYLPSGEPPTVLTNESVNCTTTIKNDYNAISKQEEIEKYIDSRLLNNSEDIDFESIMKDKKFIDLISPQQK